MKIVINQCYGGFGISLAALEWLRGRGWEHAKRCDVYKSSLTGELQVVYDHAIPRHDPLLVECVETLGDDADGFCAGLSVVEVEGAYEIDEYDGAETIRTKVYTSADLATARAEAALAEREACARYFENLVLKDSEWASYERVIRAVAKAIRARKDGAT